LVNFADIDLTGTVVVLAHTRTGSSLVMQTLSLLGVAPIGESSRTDLPASLNPKGFFEDAILLRDGLFAAPLAEDPALLRGRAVKLSLQFLAHRRSDDEWKALTQSNAALLLPIRKPSESLLSRRALLLSESQDAAACLNQFRLSSRQTFVDYAFLAQRVCSVDSNGIAPACIDYRTAIDDPSAYVAAVASAARLLPQAHQVAAAVANIDTTLYRSRAEHRDSAGSISVAPLERIYDLLRDDSPLKWFRLRDILPAWAFERI
jgi:hypothetical protein